MNTGNYETLIVDSVFEQHNYITNPKTNYYGDGSDDSNLGTTAGTQRVMLQRIPNYNDVTVNTGYNFYPSDWDGG